MKTSEGDSFKVDENTVITNLFKPEDDSNFDTVITSVEGYHPADEPEKGFWNEKSQKGYYILEGEGKMYVGEKEHQVEKGDFVFVPEKTRHALEGDFRALIVTSPPFDPETEKLVESR